MADYKELLRRAVEALPENNGAARRAVYEKARAALVGQLRAINPPLAARDITAHRLQLEDCIRQVEQEASEAVIAGLGSGSDDNAPPPPVYFEAPKKAAPPPAAAAKPVAKQAAAPKEPPRPLPNGGSIEEIIAAANAEPAEPVETRQRTVVRPDSKPVGKPVPKLVPSGRPPLVAVAPSPAPQIEEEDEVEPSLPPPVERAPQPRAAAKSPTGRPLPPIVARAEAARNRTGAAAFGAAVDNGRRGPNLEPRREATAPRLEPAARGNQQMVARQSAEPVAFFDDLPVQQAMSAVREVELEDDPQPVDPQGAIDRAIATLDREAQAELDEPYINGNGFDIEPEPEPEEPVVLPPPRKNGFAAAKTRPGVSMLRADAPAPKSEPAKKSKPQREIKPVNLQKMASAEKPPRSVPPRKGRAGSEEEQDEFPRARPEPARRGIGAVTIFLIVFAVLLLGAGGAGFWAWREGYLNLDSMFGRASPTVESAAAPVTPAAVVDAPATGPGNTDTPAASSAPAPELKQDERLAADTAAVSPALPLVEPGKSEERLGGDAGASPATAEQAVAAIDPATMAGSQSLLLEAQDNGTTGAVPFSGTVDWSRGTDERGLPTLIGKASIPARNLGVDVLIRKNSDPSLPASHLMEINFRVSDSFIGGSIAGLPGVLLKNEELVQGTPLAGASARVVGNSFLFALSASADDVAANSNLLTSRKWMDLALIYATGKRAIITLEKDEAADAMFREVVGVWGGATP